MATLSPPRIDEYLNSQGWLAWNGGEMRSQGWKLHIAIADEHSAPLVLRNLCNRVFYPMEVAHKVWPNTDPIGNLQDNGGKWLAVFPDSILNAFVLVDAIQKYIHRLGINPPPPGWIPNEIAVGTGYVYTRYGSYSFRGVKVGKSWQADNRTETHPTGIDNPWVSYGPAAHSGRVRREWIEPFPSFRTSEVPRSFW